MVVRWSESLMQTESFSSQESTHAITQSKPQLPAFSLYSRRSLSKITAR
jgi:hypothetical protein